VRRRAAEESSATREVKALFGQSISNKIPLTTNMLNQAGIKELHKRAAIANNGGHWMKGNTSSIDEIDGNSRVTLFYMRLTVLPLLNGTTR
jgi:hypothetical protein